MKRGLALIVLAACTNDVRVGAPLRKMLDVPPDPPAALDVLFVIDPTSSATQDREALIAAAGDAVFGELERKLGALPDLHVGVISAEVAQGGLTGTLPIGCDDTHDGALRTGQGFCANVSGHFLIDAPGSDGGRVRNYTSSLGDAFSCLADLPASTCAVAQPIQAVRDALGRNAPGVNADFLRDYAMLLVVFVAPRDDCSSDLLSFYAPGEWDSMPMDARCFGEAAACDDGGHCDARADGALVEIPRIADELRALKRDPSMVMIAGVFAVPDRVTLVTQSAGDVVPAPVCGGAMPAPRLAALAQEFPARYAYAPMCGGDATAQLRAVTDVAAGVIGGGHCLIGPVPQQAPCRAYAETDVARARIGFTIAPTDACAGFESGLAATPTDPPGDAHFVVECEAPPGL